MPENASTKTNERPKKSSRVKTCRKSTMRDSSACASHKIMTIRKRCPKGTRRNTNGVCEPVSVKMLGKTELFQVSFDEKKIKRYKQVSDSKSSAASFLNASVLLDFVDANDVKKELIGINKRDIHFNDAINNFEKYFELPSGSLRRVSLGLYEIPGLNEIMNDSLSANHATLLSLILDDNKDFPTEVALTHYIVAYKKKAKSGKDVIYYFDPRSKRLVNNIDELYSAEVLGENYKPRRNLPG